MFSAYNYDQMLGLTHWHVCRVQIRWEANRCCIKFNHLYDCNQQFGKQSDKTSHLNTRVFPSGYILFQLIAH